MTDDDRRDQNRPRTPPTGVRRALGEPPRLTDPFEGKTPPLGSPAFREMERALADPRVPTIEKVEMRARVAQRQTKSTLDGVEQLRKETQAQLLAQKSDIDRLDRKADAMHEHLLENTALTHEVVGKLDGLAGSIERAEERRHKRALSEIALGTKKKSAKIDDDLDAKKTSRRTKLKWLGAAITVLAALVAGYIKLRCGIGGE
jgi:hypothetical protein